MSEQVIEAEQRVEGRRRWVLWVLVAVAVLSPLLVFVAFWVGASWHVAAALEEVRAAGYPATARELDDWYEPVPAGDNAALVILDGAGRIRWPRDDAIREHLPFVGEGADLPAPAEPLPERMRREIEAVVADHADALARLHEGAAMERSRYPVDLSEGWFQVELPHLLPLRNGVNLLAIEATGRAEANDAAGAVGSVRAMLGVADSLRDEPVLISHLWRVAWQQVAVDVLERVIHRAPPNEPLLAELADLLLAAEDPRGLRRAMAGERAVLSDAFTGHQSEPASEVYYWTGVGALDHLAFLEVMERIMAATEGPAHQRLEAVHEAMAWLDEAFEFQTMLTRVVMPSLPRAMIADHRGLARLRVARAAIAIERYRIAHGELPDSLDDLTPDLLDAIPLDPFAGDPLNFRRLDIGYTVYSVGEDGTDHGGRRLSAAGHPFEAGADIPFTVARE